MPCLLHAYWALSGYGLQASRAFSRAGRCFAGGHRRVRHRRYRVLPAAGSAPSHGEPRHRRDHLPAWSRPRSQGLGRGGVRRPRQRRLVAFPRTGAPLTGIGKLTDVVLRLLTPLLLALGLLAVVAGPSAERAAPGWCVTAENSSLLCARSGYRRRAVRPVAYRQPDMFSAAGRGPMEETGGSAGTGTRGSGWRRRRF